jgi:hypothetical protein
VAWHVSRVTSGSSNFRSAVMPLVSGPTD